MGKFKDMYPEQPGHRGVETSIDAAKAVDSKQIRNQIIQELEGSAGYTSVELAVLLQLPFFSVQPRLSELKAMGMIHDTGIRREGRTKQKMIVWQKTPADLVKPPKSKIKPVGNKELWAEMMNAVYAYGNQPDINNQMQLHKSAISWAESFAGEVGQIKYNIT